MIPKYKMRTAKRIDNGESVTGYYFYTEGDNKHWIWKCGEFKREIDPDTLEPVRVKPIKVYDDYCKADRYKCPNCNNYIITGAHFCQWRDCGMAIDWEEIGE